MCPAGAGVGTIMGKNIFLFNLTYIPELLSHQIGFLFYINFLLQTDSIDFL